MVYIFGCRRSGGALINLSSGIKDTTWEQVYDLNVEIESFQKKFR